MAAVEEAGRILRSRVHARIGLLGNPSDGFNGSCISFSLANFHAEVTLTPSPTLRFLPNPDCDACEFDSLRSLARHLQGWGFNGGMRLLQAMCKRFYEHCRAWDIPLPPDAGNFTLSYTTTIPRQCGLSGSSAIACATLNCLLRHYRLEEAVPVAERPSLVLGAEEELGIAAGLQDRVVQVYGGLVEMDFDASHMQLYGHGRYKPMDPCLLPPQPHLQLIYSSAAPSGKDSGSVHSDVRQRWLAGDATVRQPMQQLAELAVQGRQALMRRDWQQLHELMNENFRLRRQLYGDAVIGKANLAMVQAARAVGAAAKLTGSGGAVVALCCEAEQQVAHLRQACKEQGFECVAVQVGPALHTEGTG